MEMISLVGSFSELVGEGKLQNIPCHVSFQTAVGSWTAKGVETPLRVCGLDQ